MLTYTFSGDVVLDATRLPASFPITVRTTAPGTVQVGMGAPTRACSYMKCLDVKGGGGRSVGPPTYAKKRRVGAGLEGVTLLWLLDPAAAAAAACDGGPGQHDRREQRGRQLGALQHLQRGEWEKGREGSTWWSGPRFSFATIMRVSPHEHRWYQHGTKHVAPALLIT